MNKNVVMLSAALVLLLSCSREVDHVIQPGETITFTAGWEGIDDTRTILQPDGTSVWWESSAQINIFFGDKASGRFTSTNSQAQAIVDFTGSLPIVVGSVETDNPAHAYWAVYPYDSTNTCDGESVTLAIPSTQTAVEETFSNKMFPSIATSTNFYLAFYNVCGGVRFSVANEGISSVTFKANNGESLVGKVQVGFDGAPIIKKVTEGSTEITVNAPSEGFIPGKEYFAVILPQTLSKGVTLTFKKANGTVASTSIDNAITVNRSRFGTMTEKDKGLKFEGSVEVDSVELDLTSVTLRVGETTTLIATIKPEDATDKTLKWTSSNENVATVDNHGKVTAVLEGNTVISATAGDITASCSIVVTPAGFMPNENYLSFTGLDAESSISHNASSDSYHTSIEYSYDAVNWYPWDKSLTISLVKGSQIFVRGNKIVSFKMTGEIAASGNFMSLLYSDDFADKYSFEGYSGSLSPVFKGCKSLVEAPELPATVLHKDCYREMFSGTGLTKAPALPATTLTESCYQGMFYGCSSLTTAPELPATTLIERCYSEMFRGCSSLETAPSLPATTLAQGCYSGMFYGCESLTAAPELPATTLAISCYYDMFRSCKSLTEAPKLPATTLTYGCYSGMFLGCESLTAAPELPATTLAESCYSGMFAYCNALTVAPKLPATTLAESCYSGMFSYSDALTEAPELPATTLAKSCYSQMFCDCDALTVAPMLPATTLAESCYSGMFDYCKSLIAAPKLQATTLAKGCYGGMFRSCESLTTVPELPATILADGCYEQMFSGCSSLTATPELPAMTLASRCYWSMFSSCSSLTTVPSILPATTLSDACYEKMFYNCGVLTTAPELPATSMAPSCYSEMFRACNSLEIAPNLPGTTLAENCYLRMFSDCTNLSRAPELLAATLVKDCYCEMFARCEKISYLKMLALNIPNKSFLSGYLYRTATTGTFVKHASASWTEDGIIPSGWTVLTATE